MANSTLGNMHSWGLFACESLQNLHLAQNCAILADNQCATLQTDAGLQCHLPTTLMHCLVSLTGLYFHAYAGIHHDDLTAFWCVLSLERLDLYSPDDATVCMKDSWAGHHLFI